MEYKCELSLLIVSKSLYYILFASEMLTILTNAGQTLKRASIGDFVKDQIPSLKAFLSEGNAEEDYNIPSLAALSSSMRLLQR